MRIAPNRTCGSTQNRRKPPNAAACAKYPLIDARSRQAHISPARAGESQSRWPPYPPKIAFYQFQSLPKRELNSCIINSLQYIVNRKSGKNRPVNRQIFAKNPRSSPPKHNKRPNSGGYSKVPAFQPHQTGPNRHANRNAVIVEVGNRAETYG